MNFRLVRVVAHELPPGRDDLHELGPLRVAFQVEVDARAQQVENIPKALDDVDLPLDAALGPEPAVGRLA
jgi:hypothetical protein